MKLTWINEKIKQLNEGRSVDDIVASVSTKQISQALISDSTLAEWEEIAMCAIDSVSLLLGDGPHAGETAIGERFVEAIKNMGSIQKLFPELEDPSLMEAADITSDKSLKEIKERAEKLLEEVEMSEDEMLYVAKYSLMQIIEAANNLMGAIDFLDTIEAQINGATTESKKVVKEEAFDPTFDEFVNVFKDIGFFALGDNQQGRLHDPLDGTASNADKAVRLSRVFDELDNMRATENVFDSDDASYQFSVVLSDGETQETFNLNVKVIFDREGITLEYNDE